MAEHEHNKIPMAAHRDPFQQFQQEIGRWWDRDWWPWPSPRFGPLARRTEENWVPRVDIYEEGKEIVIKAELPGVKREDIEVTLEDNDLILRGERKTETEVKEENYFRLERGVGVFYRRLTLPVVPDAAQIKAKLLEGVLEVRLPKPEQQHPRARQIDVA